MNHAREAASSNSGTILSKDGGLFWLGAAASHPDSYTQITGFSITYTLLTGGALGSPQEPFPINSLMVASGARTAEDFGWKTGGVMPQFIGPAKEIVTHATGQNSYLGTMFFSHGQDAGPLAKGESATMTYEGSRALFRDGESIITVCGLFGTVAQVTGVTWIFGEIDSSIEDTLVWEPVETVEYPDLPTVENGTSNNYVDITVPKGEGPFPVVLWIHGGGFTQLDRKACFIPETMKYLLYKGYAIASVEYTLSVNVGGRLIGGYPNMVHDVKAAVRFLRANAAKYKLDTGFIAAMGESAGACLAMLVGTTNNSTEADHEDLSTGNPEHSSAVQSMVSYFGPARVAQYFSELGSPYDQLTADAPPLFLTHGENDAAVSIEDSYAMEAKAKELLGADKVDTLYYVDAPHASKAAFDTPKNMEAVAAFLDKHR